MNRTIVTLTLVATLVSLRASTAAAQAPGPRATATGAAEPRPKPSPQLRPHSMRVPVDPARIEVDDGDTVVIQWSKDDREIVRILGIDTPETRHLEHNLPYAQSFGPEARGFAQGAFAAATQVELLRASTVDPYGRSLGYLFLNGRNYSVLVVRARFSAETVTFYGDNGLPTEAAEVLAAAKTAGPVPFEPPHVFRGRMRDVTKWMKENGLEAEQ
ncbi:MAG TPA: thermonuclease family protein [Vicinamibacteria bacterium]|nr:thermonuclease family protein [Vicinamibacteria bacterium]